MKKTYNKVALEVTDFKIESILDAASTIQGGDAQGGGEGGVEGGNGGDANARIGEDFFDLDF